MAGDRVQESRNMIDRVQVKFKKLTESAVVPQYKSAEAAGMDLCADESVVVYRDNIKLIKTGIAIELPQGYEAQVRPRSGLALKHGITVLNSPGTVDSDYRGDISVMLINLGTEVFHVERGDRIAQLIITPVSKAEMIEVKELGSSERGEGGFGSTGK